MAKGVYYAGHHQLLAHGLAAKVYREKYKATQKGQLGMVLSSEWKEPMCHNMVDEEAAELSLLWYIGWFADPLFKVRFRIRQRPTFMFKKVYVAHSEKRKGGFLSLSFVFFVCEPRVTTRTS